MLAKKMGDLGGMTSKKTEDILAELAVEHADAARVIEFFGEAKDLSEEQQTQLDEAKLSFASTEKRGNRKMSKKNILAFFDILIKFIIHIINVVIR